MQNKYADLENILYIGFIPMKISIGEIELVLKTVNDIEYDKIILMSGLVGSSRYRQRFNINYLIYSIFMINGVNFLNLREEYYYDIYSILKNFPLFFFKKIFEILEKLNKKLTLLTNLLEPYAYEEDSKFNWQYKKFITINDPKNTGVKGTEYLGINQFQKYWINLNIREDKDRLFEENYGLAKFLASFQDSKSVKKIQATDDSRKKQEEERRERLRNGMITDQPQKVHYLSGDTSTAEGLVKEMNRQLRGEKDEHDLMIEEYEASLRSEMLQQMKEIKENKDIHKKLDIPLRDEVRAISPEEMKERIDRAKNRTKMKSFNLESDMHSKFLQMSNVDNEKVIKQTGVMTEEEYNSLVSDDLFKDTHEKIANKIESDYKLEQRRLAMQYGLDEEIKKEILDFPNLRNK